jgi:hypothetical protein
MNKTDKEKLKEALEHLDDLFEQSDEDTPLEYRSQGFTDALRNAEDLLIEHGLRVKDD